MPVAGERAARALANLSESLPVFLTLALLILMLDVDGPAAQAGAGVFLVARALYVPCYVFGVFAVRSIVWTVAGFGLLAMAAVILGFV